MPKPLVRLPDNAPLSYAPNNEQGVVYLFSQYAKEQGLRVESIQAGFPDCTAYRDGRRVRIEFEFRSRNFLVHRHKAKHCDMLVCWVHDWPDVPSNLEVVELRKEYGLGFNVWLQPVAGEYSEILMDTKREEEWSVASQASPEDLVLFYHAKPHSCIRDIFKVAAPVFKEKLALWKKGSKLRSPSDYFAKIKRVGVLKTPIYLSELREHRVMSTSPVVRRSMVGRFRATPYWRSLHEMITERNPALRRVLNQYGPHRLAN